jgi:hypothetical protein
VIASRAVSKSREIDSRRQRADSIPRPLRFQIAACERRDVPHPVNAFRPRESRASIIFRGFLALVGRATDGETPLAAHVRTR